jgi:hypothetical protein
MLHVFNAWNNAPLFQTAWFIESLCTQTLVIFVIRTRRLPFFKSKPSKLLLVSSLTAVAIAILLPFTPLGELFQFARPSLPFFAFLTAFVAVYLTMVETVKRRFYKRYANRLEQIAVPLKRPAQPTPTAKLTQNMIAMMCLRYDDEISVESLLNDLKAILVYPVDSEHIVDTLHQLQRAKLADIDWRTGKVNRQPELKSYIQKLVKSEQWPKLVADWRRIGSMIQARYYQVNPEYQKLITQS